MSPIIKGNFLILKELEEDMNGLISNKEDVYPLNLLKLFPPFLPALLSNG